MSTTRERKIQFINDHGHDTLIKLVKNEIYRNGAEFFTDEQIEQLTSKQVVIDLFTARLNRQNRARRAG